MNFLHPFRILLRRVLAARSKRLSGHKCPLGGLTRLSLGRHAGKITQAQLTRTTGSDETRRDDPATGGGRGTAQTGQGLADRGGEETDLDEDTTDETPTASGYC